MRKISPHLSIYSFPVTAISSISNRVSGIYITASLIGTIFFTFSSEKNKNIIFQKYHSLNENSKKMLNSILLYPFGYHFTGGVRHLLWDSFPHLLTNAKVASSSRAIFLLSIFPTLLLENKLKDKFK